MGNNNYFGLYAKDYLTARWNPESEKDPFALQRRKCREDIIKFIKDKNLKTVLDVGCGTGRIALPLALEGIKVTAVDISEEILSVARNKAKEFNVEDTITFEVGNAENIKHSPNSFDAVCCVEVLEHIRKPQEAIRNLLKVAKKYCILTIPEINFYNKRQTLLKKFIRLIYFKNFMKPIRKFMFRKFGYPVGAIPYYRAYSEEEIISYVKDCEVIIDIDIEKIIEYKNINGEIIFFTVFAKKKGEKWI